jgi:hypothetical protein
VLQDEIASMAAPAEKAAVGNLLAHLYHNIPTDKHAATMHTTYVNFLEKAQCPEGENSCLNLHIHAIVYLLNSRQLLICSSCSAPPVAETEQTDPSTDPSRALDEAEKFLLEMKELGI